MTALLDPVARAKLSAILVQMDADEDGVLVASALAAKRFLKARGLHWRDVLPPLLPESRAHEQARDWRAIVAACLQHRELLSPRDLDFLLGASRFPYLSEKQQRRLNGIADKLGVS